MAVNAHFDLQGQQLALPESVVRELCTKAVAASGSSSVCRDLAALLERALVDGKPVALQRVEARALFRLLGYEPSQRASARGLR
jgi:hypothetical protein